MSFSENLKKQRKERGMSQEKLSSLSGISQQSISFIENGTNSPTLFTAEKLADALNVSMIELLGYSAPPASVVYDTPLTETERQLISDYRTLNSQGREIILQQMDMVKKIYGSDFGVSDLEERQVMGE